MRNTTLTLIGIAMLTAACSDEQPGASPSTLAGSAGAAGDTGGEAGASAIGQAGVGQAGAGGGAGVAVLGSSAPEDRSLILACEPVNDMLKERPDVRDELIRRKARFAIIGRDEGTADIPEYGYGNRPQADIDYINRRARGLGGQVASCGEESILCLPGDRYWTRASVPSRLIDVR